MKKLILVVSLIGFLISCSKKKEAEKGSCECELQETQYMVGTNESIKFFYAKGFKPKNLDCWVYLKEHAKKTEATALSSEFRYYIVPTNATNREDAYKRFNKYYIARGGKNTQETQGCVFWFEPNPMGNKHFFTPSEFDDKIRVTLSKCE